MGEGISRRGVIGVAAGALGLLLPGRARAAQQCIDTPQQTEGPFYPVEDQADKDNDLTAVRGATGTPIGEVIYIFGTVTDEACAPVANALVEIWQACASGRYDHPGDTSGNPLDPNFQYWGQAVTDANGKYQFKTIIPGAYLADVDWMRPPHIHWKAHAMGFYELTTQTYFTGNQYNAADLIRAALSAADRTRVTLDLLPSTQDPTAQQIEFDMTLHRVR